jgi:superfamily II DNA/RNA helicase
MPFSDLGLSDKVVSAVSAAGYTEPTPIQAQAIPRVLEKRDLIGIAQTGTGKTAAFVLPMLTLLETGRARARMPRTLILEPTRELAAQVEENFNKYGTNQRLSVALIIGGVSFGDQDAKITRGVDVLIATPGRLLDHFERGKLLLNGIEILVIDEADRMLDMGFMPDIERICKLTPFTRQTLFFSATMPPEIRRVTEQFLSNPVQIEVAKAATTATTITQNLMRSGGDPEAKRETLRKLIRAADGMKNAIVFCNRKRDVAVVHKSLVKHGFNAGALHGDMDQTSRTRTLDAFRANELTVLVASDVAARGLDIPDVSHVFNFDVPHHADDYVHRIGRTGRAGRSGWSITIVSSHDTKSVSAIEKLIGRSIPYLEAIEAIATAPEERAVEGRAERPRREGRGERGRRSAQTSEGTQPMPTPARAEEAPRPERPARVARNEPERTKPAGPMNERQRMPRDRDQASLPGDDAGHMPAFLLRMKRTAPVKKA